MRAAYAVAPRRGLLRLRRAAALVRAALGAPGGGAAPSRCVAPASLDARVRGGRRRAADVPAGDARDGGGARRGVARGGRPPRAAATGRAQAVRVRRSGAALAAASHVHCPTSRRRRDGMAAAASTPRWWRRATRAAAAALVPCADGGAVFVDCAAPPADAAAPPEFLGCECRADAIGRAVGAYPSADALEGALQAAGLCAAMARAPREWRESPHGQSVAALPPVGLAPVAARIPIVRRRRAAPTLAYARRRAAALRRGGGRVLR